MGLSALAFQWLEAGIWSLAQYKHGPNGLCLAFSMKCCPQQNKMLAWIWKETEVSVNPSLTTFEPDGQFRKNTRRLKSLQSEVSETFQKEKKRNN